MSLLNEVLKELDQRRHREREPEILTSVLMPKEPDQFDWSSALIALFVVFVASSATYWAVAYRTSKDSLSSTFETLQSSSPLPSLYLSTEYEKVSQLRLPTGLSVTMLPGESVRGEFAATKDVYNADLKERTTEHLVESSIQHTPPARVIAPTAAKPSGVAELRHSETSISQIIKEHSGGSGHSWELKNLFSQDLTSEDLTAISRLFSTIKFSRLNVEDLLNYVEINRLLIDAGYDQTPVLRDLFTQLYLKSDEPGYWAFQLAVLLDRLGALDDAAYYYAMAVRTDDISTRKIQLSQMRLEQLSNVLRR